MTKSFTIYFLNLKPFKIIYTLRNHFNQLIKGSASTIFSMPNVKYFSVVSPKLSTSVMWPFFSLLTPLPHRLFFLFFYAQKEKKFSSSLFDYPNQYRKKGDERQWRRPTFAATEAKEDVDSKRSVNAGAGGIMYRVAIEKIPYKSND